VYAAFFVRAGHITVVLWLLEAVVKVGHWI